MLKFHSKYHGLEDGKSKGIKKTDKSVDIFMANAIALGGGIVHND